MRCDAMQPAACDLQGRSKMMGLGFNEKLGVGQAGNWLP